MGTMMLEQIKRQASTFIQDKYKTARLVLKDVTPSELLAEDATNGDPCMPDACTMKRITQASYDFEDYWRVCRHPSQKVRTHFISHVKTRLFLSLKNVRNITYGIHGGRSRVVDWKLWRQSYKTLVLLDFLLTHGPKYFAEEFDSDNAVIKGIATFEHVDNKGFDWGEKMQKKAERILKLISDDKSLKEARLKALMVTQEIQGFGSSSSSSSSPSSSPLSFHRLSPRGGQPNYAHGGIRDGTDDLPAATTGKSVAHSWDRRVRRETGQLLNQEENGYRIAGHENGGSDRHSGGGYISEICSKIASLSPRKLGQGDHERVSFRSLSDAGKAKMEKKFNRQFSIGY